MKYFIPTALFLVLSAAACQTTPTSSEATTSISQTATKVEYPDSLIDNSFEPCTRLGKLHNKVSTDELIKLYGKDNVTTYYSDFDGKKVASTLLFEGQRNELQILWHNDELLQYPNVCLFNKANAVWQIPEGIKIGMTLAELEQINGKPFDFMGFHTGQNGVITGWQEGKLQTLLQCFHVVLDFDRANNASLVDDSMKANTIWKSNDAKVQALQPKVSAIRVFLNKSK